jgi:hypothetical protein
MNEPWLTAYRRALVARRAPLVYLLVSWQEAEAIAARQWPRRLVAQAKRLVTWQPGRQRRGSR